MYQDRKTFQVVKNQQALEITLREQKLYIKCKSNAFILNGIYAYDALPQLLKIFSNIKEIFHHLDQIKNTDYLQISPEGIEISFPISIKITKKVLLVLEKKILNQQQKLEAEVEQLTNQLQRLIKQKGVLEKNISKVEKLEEEKYKIKHKFELKIEELKNLLKKVLQEIQKLQIDFQIKKSLKIENQKLKDLHNESIKKQKNLKDDSQNQQKQLSESKKLNQKLLNSLRQSEQKLKVEVELKSQKTMKDIQSKKNEIIISKNSEQKIISIELAQKHEEKYIKVKNQQKTQQIPQKKIERLPPTPKTINWQNQLMKLKKQINVDYLSSDDVKKILDFTIHFTQSLTSELSHELKLERRKKFKKEDRMRNIYNYFQQFLQGLIKIDEFTIKTQKKQLQLLESIGVSQQRILKRYHQLAHLIMPQLRKKMILQNANVQDIRKRYQIKIKYLKTNGNKIITSLISIMHNFPLEIRLIMPPFFNTIIADDLFQNIPELDRDSFQTVSQYYKEELSKEIHDYLAIIMPLLQRLKYSIKINY